jgi:hypothetical protein
MKSFSHLWYLLSSLAVNVRNLLLVNSQNIKNRSNGIGKHSQSDWGKKWRKKSEQLSVVVLQQSELDGILTNCFGNSSMETNVPLDINVLIEYRSNDQQNEVTNVPFGINEENEVGSDDRLKFREEDTQNFALKLCTHFFSYSAKVKIHNHILLPLDSDSVEVKIDNCCSIRCLSLKQTLLRER